MDGLLRVVYLVYLLTCTCADNTAHNNAHNTAHKAGHSEDDVIQKMTDKLDCEFIVYFVNLLLNAQLYTCTVYVQNTFCSHIEWAMNLYSMSVLSFGS